MIARTQLRPGSSSALRRAVAVVCVLLILLVGAAHLLHSHGTNQAPDPGCSLCAVAHMSALPAPVLDAPTAAEVVIALQTRDHVPAPRHRLFHHLYIRPPPVGSKHA